MPKLDGHERARRSCGATRPRPHIPVVFLTARTTTEDVVEGLRLGAHDYLRKPFEPAELLARVSAALRVKRLQDELRHPQHGARGGEPHRRAHRAAQPSPPAGAAAPAASAAARATATRVAVLMVDVDHFKRVNDRSATPAATTCCAAIALRLANACRAEDVAGRWGGEEFLVVSPGHRRRRGRGARRTHPRRGRGRGRSTVEGAGAGGGDGERRRRASGSDDVDAIVRNADAALYEAKETGRNRVVTRRR